MGLKEKKYLKLRQLEENLKEEGKSLQQFKEELEKKQIVIDSYNTNILKLQNEIKTVREENKQKAKRKMLLLFGILIIGTIINLGVYYKYKTENEEKIRQYREEMEEKEGKIDGLIEALKQKE